VVKNNDRQPYNWTIFEKYIKMKKIKVLIVEDTETGSLLLQSVLEENKIFEIHLAKSGNEALNLLEQCFDLILLDLMLPETDGFTILETIKNDEKTSQIPVIVVSAKSSVKDRKLAIKKGAVDFISKPYSFEEITSAIYQAIDLDPENPDILKILVVDDSQLSRNKLCKILSQFLNLEIMYAQDGIQALELINKQHFDCIFMDILMPNMNGFETLNELKKRNIDTPIAIVSADIQQTTTKKCMDLGASWVLGKPLQEDKIKEIIHNLLIMNPQNV
jgi:CheY-like chemotaxis protein